MPKSSDSNQAARAAMPKKAKPSNEAFGIGQKQANLANSAPKILEVEQAAARVKRHAKEPVDRTAELLLEESDVTKAGVSNTQNSETSRVER